MKTQLKQQKNNNDSIPRCPYIFKMYFVTIVSRELIRTSAGTTTCSSPPASADA